MGRVKRLQSIWKILTLVGISFGEFFQLDVFTIFHMFTES